MKQSPFWILILVILMIFSPMTTSASSWSTFGKDQYRTREAVNQFVKPEIVPKWDVKNIGWSISQPVVGNGHIYHQAGGYLYKIPLDMPFQKGLMTTNKFLNQGAERTKISNDYHAASHPVYDDQTNSIYVGTGENRIRKIDPDTLNVEYDYKKGGRLVNAPAVLGENLMAYGDGKANLYIFKGLNRQQIRLGSSPMEVTGTFAVKDGKNPIIYVPVNYKGINHEGFVDAFKVIDNGSGKAPSYKPVWSKPFKTKNGVSTSVVYDDKKNRIYFADKSGNIYAVNAKNGKQVWRNTTYSSYSSHITLVNNSPALSGNTLVVPFRYMNGRNKGMIVAFNKNTGKAKWKRTSAGKKSGSYKGEIANAPAISKDGNGRSTIYVGNTEGQLRAYDLNNGKPKYITEKNGKKRKVLNALKGTGASYYQGAGLATELLISDEHLVFGANSSETPNASGTNGRLYAYSTLWCNEDEKWDGESCVKEWTETDVHKDKTKVKLIPNRDNNYWGSGSSW